MGRYFAAPDGPVQVLLAVTEPTDRSRLLAVLEAARCEVMAETADGAEAIVMARALRPDVVVIDADLPIHDGVSVAEVLYRDRVAPSILIAGGSGAELARRAAAAGAYAVLTKPYHEATLTSSVEFAHAYWQRLRGQERKIKALKDKETTREVVERAKRILMGDGRLTEAHAYRLLQVRSMNTRRSIRAIAEAVVISHGAVGPVLQRIAAPVREREAA